LRKLGGWTVRIGWANVVVVGKKYLSKLGGLFVDGDCVSGAGEGDGSC
jgi:hypothetical protein